MFKAPRKQLVTMATKHRQTASASDADEEETTPVIKSTKSGGVASPSKASVSGVKRVAVEEKEKQSGEEEADETTAEKEAAAARPINKKPKTDAEAKGKPAKSKASKPEQEAKEVEADDKAASDSEQLADADEPQVKSKPIKESIKSKSKDVKKAVTVESGEEGDDGGEAPQAAAAASADAAQKGPRGALQKVLSKRDGENGKPEWECLWKSGETVWLSKDQLNLTNVRVQQKLYAFEAKIEFKDEESEEVPDLEEEGEGAFFPEAIVGDRFNVPKRRREYRTNLEGSRDLLEEYKASKEKAKPKSNESDSSDKPMAEAGEEGEEAMMQRMEEMAAEAKERKAAASAASAKAPAPQKAGRIGKK